MRAAFSLAPAEAVGDVNGAESRLHRNLMGAQKVVLALVITRQGWFGATQRNATEPEGNEYLGAFAFVSWS